LEVKRSNGNSIFGAAAEAANQVSYGEGHRGTRVRALLDGPSILGFAVVNRLRSSAQQASTGNRLLASSRHRPDPKTPPGSAD
jgi:hypothetical protein